jgi:hypothetical protein
VLLSLFQQLAIDDEVFFSGDGGVKALMVRQFAAGGWHADLRLEGEGWTRALWGRGLYPFGPPFVYEVGERRVVQYPLPLPALTAPFYAWLGFRGLTVLPLLGLWVTWGAVLWLCRRAGLPPSASALALAGTIFATHLTPYGAMFWEHTLGVGLSLAGLAALWPQASGVRAPRWAALGGAFLGLACWLRPESASFLVAAFAGVWAAGLEHRRLLGAAFAAAVALLAFAALNQWLYGTPLGLHAVQQADPTTAHLELEGRWSILQQLGVGLSWHASILVLAVASVALGLRRSELRPDRVEAALWVVLLVFLATVVWIVPTSGGKQFGPRHLLHAAPILWLIAAVQWHRWGPCGWLGGALRASAVALLALGSFANAYQGTRALYRDYDGRVLPALRVLREDPSPVVAVGHQWMAQELEALIGDKAFFLTDDDEELRLLAKALLARGQQRFPLLLYGPSPLVRQYPRFVLRVYPVRTVGTFVLHRCEMTP